MIVVALLCCAAIQSTPAQRALPLVQQRSLQSYALAVDEIVPRVRSVNGSSDSSASPVSLVLTGAVFGAAGAGLGWFIGSFASEGAAIVGAAVFESLMLPLGVHIANPGHGDYGINLAISGLVASVGLLYVLYKWIDESLHVAGAVVPISQLAIILARRASR